MIYHIAAFFFFFGKHFRVSIRLKLYWSPILEALLEMKKKEKKKKKLKILQNVHNKM